MLSPNPLAPPARGISPGLCRPKQSLQPLARHPKRCFPSPQLQLTLQPLHPSRGGGLREAFAIRVPIASFPLASKCKRQPQSSPWEHLPPPQHSALAVPRRPQQGTASGRSPSLPPTTSHPPTHRGGRGWSQQPVQPQHGHRDCQYHRQEFRWGQVLPDHRKPPVTSSKGAGSGKSLRAPHFFSLTNEKKKKIPYLSPRCPHTMNF